MPVSMGDLGSFVQMIAHAFEQPLFYGFTAMIAFSVSMYVKSLLVDGNR